MHGRKNIKLHVSSVSECYSHSKVTVCATCNVTSHVERFVLYISTFRSTCAVIIIIIIITTEIAQLV